MDKIKILENKPSSIQKEDAKKIKYYDKYVKECQKWFDFKSNETGQELFNIVLLGIESLHLKRRELEKLKEKQYAQYNKNTTYRH